MSDYTTTCPTCWLAWLACPMAGTAVTRGPRGWDVRTSTLLHPTETATETGWRWACICGATVALLRPAYDIIPCRPHGADCPLLAKKRHLPADRWVKPRHGMACDCCGHAGHHRVRKDRQGALPACLPPGA